VQLPRRPLARQRLCERATRRRRRRRLCAPLSVGEAWR
jgi:hypothetical protein